MSKFDLAISLIFGIVFVSRDSKLAETSIVKSRLRTGLIYYYNDLVV